MKENIIFNEVLTLEYTYAKKKYVSIKVHSHHIYHITRFLEDNSVI